MTAEICMMNRLAVVLAADSATTVSRWVDGKREERYFKGANKVFQLSNMQPVGLMIYDSADILNVPWELIVKSFREHINLKSFNSVEEYAREMFSYLSDNPRFFPEQIQNEKLIEATRGVVLDWISTAIDGVEKDEQRKAVETALIANRDAALAKAVPDCLDDVHIGKVTADLCTEVEKILSSLLKYLDIKGVQDLPSFCIGALHEVIKNSSHYLDTTGLVFAGFGDHEIFPAMVEFESQGMVGGKHIYERKRGVVLDHHQPAWLEAFAQTEMVDTFNAGFSFDAYSSIMVAVGDNLRGFAEEIAQKSGGNFAAIDDVDSLIQGAREKIGSGMIDNARKEHSLPLRRVLGVLPANEMAELAETLITLQSLKEKVTKPSETVGGPVDVAIITKHEGLVWVKRKHFFHPDLNSRFRLRQATQHS
ncbi:hypothetical protein CO657_04050 [Rhizobium acidisoli]|uniref:Uncharacterized protein n=1 Tax=Rhizobium acidisoli TaxID=1538158 RepID=A0AAE5WNM2_9HYPH|nr:hypothetical protein [Rhizobium acidisoli]KPH10309.1 hypothetical protein AOG23_01995 [Rhizobium acidisoli]QAS77299.1 hypothetical protein CO657_04050 [Rhizobium acidisoli]